ncbi:MAG: hypothetical protein M0005_18800 [Actinomycetota bacterium]|nr:hypothetical protein [Actinomycetota bacterium]
MPPLDQLAEEPGRQARSGGGSGQVMACLGEERRCEHLRALSCPGPLQLLAQRVAHYDPAFSDHGGAAGQVVVVHGRAGMRDRRAATFDHRLADPAHLDRGPADPRSVSRRREPMAARPGPNMVARHPLHPIGACSGALRRVGAERRSVAAQPA